MEGGRAGRALFEGVKFQLAGFDAAEKFKFDDLLSDNGAVEAPFEGCTHVIVSKLQYEDPVCAAARRDGKALVTKAWVTGSLGANALMDTSSVLYMPVRDPSGIPGCKSFCICLTGYQGQARHEIMEMVDMMGSNFTRQLNIQHVTHLICYKFEGPKYEAARRSKIKMVNHRWLEDCLRNWCLMDELNYTTMSGYEMEELESQHDPHEAEPAARTPELHAELQVTKPSTKLAKDTQNGNVRFSIADHTVGDCNVASESRKQAVVKGTTPAVDYIGVEVRASECTSQAALVTPGTESNEVKQQAKKQVATSELSNSTGPEARQSPVNSDKNHVKELQKNHRRSSNADETAGVKNVASELRKQAVVKGTTPRVNGKRHAEDKAALVTRQSPVSSDQNHVKELQVNHRRSSNADDTVGVKSVASESRKQAVVKGSTPSMKGGHGKRRAEDPTAVDRFIEDVRVSGFTSQAALVTPGTISDKQAKQQVATVELSESNGTEARQSPDKNHVTELQENQFAATEASGREKVCCIERIRQQEVAEDSAEPSIGAVKDNGAGSLRKAPLGADPASGTRKTLSKDKVPSSCAPKEKAPTERASSSLKKRKSSVGGSGEEETNGTSSKKAKDDDNNQSSSEVVTGETETIPVQKSKPDGAAGVCAASEASPRKDSTAGNKAAEVVVVELSDDSREDKRKRKAKCTSGKQKKRRAKVEEPKSDPKKQRIRSKKAAGRKCVVSSTPKPWFALGGHRDEKQRYHKIIKQLGGNECKESHAWKEQTTHSVMPLRRTEKVFAAAAAGRWILKPEYLEASEKAGFFVEEEEYEYKGPGYNEENTIELEAPRKWRKSKELTGCGAFQGMTVVVYGALSTARRLGTLKNAIKAGGGCVLAAHPPYHCYLARGIDYAICGSGIPDDDRWIALFRKHKVACVREDYMADFVCKPSSSLEKHILYDTGEAESAARARLEQIKGEMGAKREKQEEEEEEEEDYPCVVCKKRDSEELMLLCGDGEKNGCNMAVHTFCCDPPMDKVPEGDWYCNKCSQLPVSC